MCPRGPPRGQGRPRELHLWCWQLLIQSCTADYFKPNLPNPKTLARTLKIISNSNLTRKVRLNLVTFNPVPNADKLSKFIFIFLEVNHISTSHVAHTQKREVQCKN